MLCSAVDLYRVHGVLSHPFNTQESLQMSLSLIPPTAHVGLITYGRHVSVCVCVQVCACRCVCMCVHVQVCVASVKVSV